MKKKRVKDSLYYYKFFLLICVEILLAFSSLGYIVIDPISITFMHIPVIVSAMLLGPLEGMTLGGIFGLTSMWKASVTATSYADQVFSPFVSGAPLESIFLSVGTRMLFGLCAGLCFSLIKNSTKWKKTGIIVMSILAMNIHSFLVTITLQILFPDTGVSVANMLAKLGTVEECIDMVIVAGIPLLVHQLGEMPFIHKLKVTLAQQQSPKRFKTYFAIGCYLMGVILLMNSLVRHCYLRIENILLAESIEVSQTLLAKLYQISLQLSVALVAFCGIVLMLMIFMEHFMKRVAEESKKDLMTGVYNKTAMESFVKSAFEAYTGAPVGVFIILDIDYFKQINDTYGHPLGDKVLKDVAKVLKSSFSQNDCIGRIGGDEFGVFRSEEVTVEELGKIGERVCRKMQGIRLENGDPLHLTCSIGMAHCNGKADFKMLYEVADQELYRSKRNGRNQFSIEACEEPVAQTTQQAFNQSL